MELISEVACYEAVEWRSQLANEPVWEKQTQCLNSEVFWMGLDRVLLCDGCARGRQRYDCKVDVLNADEIKCHCDDSRTTQLKRCKCPLIQYSSNLPCKCCKICKDTKFYIPYPGLYASKYRENFVTDKAFNTCIKCHKNLIYVYKAGEHVDTDIFNLHQVVSSQSMVKKLPMTSVPDIMRYAFSRYVYCRDVNYLVRKGWADGFSSDDDEPNIGYKNGMDKDGKRYPRLVAKYLN